MNKQPEPANTTVLSPLPEPFEREKAQKKESYHVELPSEPLSSSSFKILKEELLKDLDVFTFFIFLEIEINFFFFLKKRILKL